MSVETDYVEFSYLPENTLTVPTIRHDAEADTDAGGLDANNESDPTDHLLMELIKLALKGERLLAQSRKRGEGDLALADLATLKSEVEIRRLRRIQEPHWWRKLACVVDREILAEAEQGAKNNNTNYALTA